MSKYKYDYVKINTVFRNENVDTIARIKELAKQNKRSVSGQIVWMLSEQLKETK
jgi:hypothetical protein